MDKEDFWTEEKVKDLIYYFDEGKHSTTRVAKLLGTTYSAVANKAIRLNIENNFVTVNKGKSRILNYDIGEIKSFATCQYIEGDTQDKKGRMIPDPFCGEEALEGSPYCAEHHELCYKKPPKVNDKPITRSTN